jgi:predicted TIM-barrel enzyme
MAGRPSPTGLLPVGDANKIVLEMGEEILSLRLPIPIFAGVFGSDPFRRMEHFLPQIKALGFAGVQNFPTVCLYEGVLRRTLEEMGLGFECEVEMIGIARKLDLITSPYVFNAEEARRMVRVGADLIVVHVGTTSSGMVGAKTTPSLDESIATISDICRAAKRENGDVITLCHGGPIATPEDYRYVQERCPEVDGFFGASAMERIPTELAIVANTANFKNTLRSATRATNG